MHTCMYTHAPPQKTAPSRVRMPLAMTLVFLRACTCGSAAVGPGEGSVQGDGQGSQGRVDFSASQCAQVEFIVLVVLVLPRGCQFACL